MSAPRLIVTGGTGYLGARLVRTALSRGWSVTLLGRTRGPVGTDFVPWTLGEGLPRDALHGDAGATGHCLIHLAHDWRCEEGPAGNIGGTTRLFDESARAGIATRIFISSQSARRDAPNRYGRVKWAIEQALPEAVSFRVGLVYGGPRAAMYGLMTRLAGCRLLPMVEPRRLVQPIHIDEVVEGILAAATGGHRGVLALAGPIPVPFGTVLRLLAEKLAGRRLVVVPVNLRLVFFCCDIVQALLPASRLDRERVLGLVGTKTIESGEDLARLGVHVVPIAERLAREPAARRALLLEACIVLRACIPGRPPVSLMRRYARAAKTGAMSRPPLPGPLLRWVEPFGDDGSDLSARLRLAARLIETSPHGEAALARGSRARRLCRLAADLAMDALLLPVRVAARAVLR